MPRYSIEISTTSIALDTYIASFRDAERFEACCRACPQYGRSWACPPFDFDVLQRLSQYSSLFLVAAKIVPHDSNLTFEEFNTLIRPERIKLESRLLALERQLGGLAASYVGTCLHCPQGSCTRPKGAPCRHPELVRPSLEAYGFDIGRTTSELFNIRLQWSKNNTMPPYVVLVSGLFHNSAQEVSWQASL